MTEVFVAAHKKADVRLPGYCRMIQVGSVLHDRIDGYLYDDWGGQDNISEKNSFYCELTALYCLWKHSSADIRGLYHYRRMFYNGEALRCNKCSISKYPGEIAGFCLTEEQISEYLKESDVIDEIPYFPWPKTVEEDLLRFCYPEDVKRFSEVILNDYPAYYETFLQVMQSRHISYRNMMIAKQEIFEPYCEWLFEVLARCEGVIDISGYDRPHQRIFGYLSEILMNVWIRKHGLKEHHVPRLVVLEKDQSRADCLKKRIIQKLAFANVRLPIEESRVIDACRKDFSV